jgi:pimeloyl-ACP methyl ester carboxylesterase
MTIRRDRFWRWLTVALGLTTSAAPAAAIQVPPTELRRIALADGTTEEVEAGAFAVPESRARPTARRVTLPFYRLRSTSPHPAAPIFLLAGGPGASWLEAFEAVETHREVAFYRTLADVVLFDQRGGGRSLPAMDCPQTFELEALKPFDPQAFRAALRPALAACRDSWLAKGVDLAAYNTVENAEDVNDLRLALGYGQVTLVAGSYGSHLALALMRQHPEAVARAVLFAIEGPGQTWDDPAAKLATLRRIAADAEAAMPRGRLPEGGLLAVLERVLARLEASPQVVTIADEGTSRQVLVDADAVRRATTAAAGRRKTVGDWAEMILAMDQGDFSIVAERKLHNLTVALDEPMHYSIDCASGISAERRRRYRDDAATKLVGDPNLEYEALCDLWPSAELGESFRANVVSAIPTLILHGTWDMSTPIDNAREVAATLPNARLVEIVHGGHGALYNLFARWPPIYDRLRTFLLGGAADFPAQIIDPLPASPGALPAAATQPH